MNSYETINIAFKSGMSACWDAEKGEWDDYMYINDGFFVIKKDDCWVGVYNMDNIISIVVK